MWDLGTKKQRKIRLRNIEDQNQSTQHEDLIDQITKENEEIMILNTKNERIRNDLNFERQINERTMKELRSEKKINERLKNDEISSRYESIESEKWAKSS